MPVRDLTVLFQIIDKASNILDPILNKLDAIDGKEITASASVDADTSGAEALEGALGALDSAGQKVTSSLEKVSGAESKEGKAADEAGKKTKGAGDAAKYASGLYGTLQKTLDSTASKFDSLSDKLEPVKGKLLAVQAVITGMGAMAVMSAAKTESLVEELKGLKGDAYAAPLIDWANQGGDLDWSGKKQRLTIATDLSDLGYSTDEVKKYGTEIEKAFFQKTGAMKRYGIQSAAELASALSSAEKTGNIRGIEKLFSAGAISEEKLAKETERLRTNYEKFAFATDEMIKKQAMHNLVMKELGKTNKDFTGQATTLEQKLGVLSDKFGGLLSGIGEKLKPAVSMVVDGLIMVLDVIESIPGHDQILVFLGVLITLLTTLATAAIGLAPFFGFLAGAAKLGSVATLVGSLSGVATALGGIAAAGAAALAPLLPIIGVLAIVAASLYLVYTRTTILQDGFATLQGFIGRASAAAQKLWSLVSGGLRGNKSDLKEIGDWIKDFLDGLIPGWLSDLFSTAQSYYREAMKWFDKIMGWWNGFLKKVGEVYDKIKSMLGLGAGAGGPDMSLGDVKKSLAGYTDDEGHQVIGEYSTALLETLYNKVFKGVEPDENGKALIQQYSKSKELENYLNQLKAKEPQSLPSKVADEVSAPIEDASAAIQESGQTYVDNSAKTYNDVKEKTGSETAAGLASYNPGAFYVDLGKKGYNYIFGSDEQPAEGEGKDKKLPAGAVGATVDQSGAMIVHEKEELVPARITSGAGKLASLLGAALDFMSGRSDIEKEISERMTSQQETSSSTSQMGGVVIQSMPININPTVNVSVAQATDLRSLDIAKFIDWSRLSYEIEKVVKATFRTQEG